MALFDFLNSKKKKGEPKEQFLTGTRIQKPDEHGNYEIVCPYCLNKFSHRDVLFRASYIGTRDNGYVDFMPALDIEYERFWKRMEKEKDSILPIIIDPNDHNMVKSRDPEDESKAIFSVTDKNGIKTNKKICPECHNELPVHAGSVPNYIISLVGNTAVGKTAYLIKLVHLISKGRMLPMRRITCVPENPMAEELLKRHDEVYGDNRNEQMLSATSINFQEPAIYKLRYIEGSERKDISITFFDFPGEAIWRNDTDFIQLKARNIQNAHAWLLLLDITSLDQVRNTIFSLDDGSKYISAPQNNSGDYMSDIPNASQVVNAICQHWANSDGLVTIPVSAVLTKSDLLDEFKTELNLTGERAFLDENVSALHDMYVDCDNLLKLQTDIKTLLRDLDDNIDAHCEHYLENHLWFAVSATGVPVEKGRRTYAGRAKRATEPLEWILMQLGYLPGRMQYSSKSDMKLK